MGDVLRGMLALCAAVMALMVPSGTVLAAAATQSMAQHLYISTRIPSHRDIILDAAGNITEIYSNTTEDVTPTVYLFDTIPENKRDLTPEIYKAYRKYVPVGTAKYGTLYKAKAGAVLPFSSPSQPQQEAALDRPVLKTITAMPVTTRSGLQMQLQPVAKLQNGWGGDNLLHTSFSSVVASATTYSQLLAFNQ